MILLKSTHTCSTCCGFLLVLIKNLEWNKGSIFIIQLNSSTSARWLGLPLGMHRIGQFLILLKLHLWISVFSTLWWFMKNKLKIYKSTGILLRKKTHKTTLIWIPSRYPVCDVSEYQQSTCVSTNENHTAAHPSTGNGVRLGEYVAGIMNEKNLDIKVGHQHMV